MTTKYSISYLIGFLAGIIIPIALGVFTGGKYSKIPNPNRLLITILIWSNLITWIFPVIRYFTSVFTIEIASIGTDLEKKKAKLLGHLGLTACLVGGLLNVIYTRA